MGKLGLQSFALVSLFSNGDSGLEKLEDFLGPEMYDVVSPFFVLGKHMIHLFHAMSCTVIQRALVE